jgi:ribose transport system permease protein
MQSLFPDTPRRSTLLQVFAQSVRRRAIVWGFALFLCIIAVYSKSFLTERNLVTVLRQVSIQGIIALGMTYVMIAGEIDLSVGSLLSLTTVLVVDLHDKAGPIVAILIGLVVGIISGCITGLFVGLLKRNSLICSLGMLSILQGLTFLYTHGQDVEIRNPDRTWFKFFGREDLLGIPAPVVIFAILACILTVVLRRTVYGRQLFAIGGNSIAGRYTGMSPGWLKFSVFVLSGALTGVGAVVLASRVMGSQNQAGEGYELQVIAAVVLGGTSLLGGEGAISKTIIGVLILGFLRNALLLLGLPYYDQWVVTWLILVAAAWAEVVSKRNRLFA